MATPVLQTAVLLYVAAAAAWLVAFVWPAKALVARAALALTMSGFVVQAAAIGLGCAETHGRHLLTVFGAAGLVGWLTAGAFLVVERVLRKPAVGALVLPLVIASIVREALAPVPVAGAPSALSGVPALRLHVMSAAGGIAVLALACAVGLMFLAQERELKGKRFGPLLSRLPPLQVLDRANAARRGSACSPSRWRAAPSSRGPPGARSGSGTASRSRRRSSGPCSGRWSSRVSRGIVAAARRR